MQSSCHLLRKELLISARLFPDQGAKPCDASPAYLFPSGRPPSGLLLAVWLASLAAVALRSTFYLAGQVTEGKSWCSSFSFYR